jgi:hypothetical protein
MIFMPKRGNVDRSNGNTAQCMAQAMEVMIPNASKLILLMYGSAKCTKFATELQNHKLPYSQDELK